jgi:hypothetical protein
MHVQLKQQEAFFENASVFITVYPESLRAA